jgi:Carbamoylphosphate synthase large subunit (split gene in MJ)
MNLLVTNSHGAQAYAIIRALRPYAARIVATMNGPTRWKARMSHGANSRHVDARYYVPDPEADWSAGVLEDTNSDAEAAYIRRIEDICRAERIDTIFPSSDAEVYVFSKNKARFDHDGIICVVQDYASLTIPLDKYETIRAARRVGFPCPETIVPERAEDIRAFANAIPPPWIIKPRCTYGGRGTTIVRCPEDLEPTYRQIAGERTRPMIQELVPGRIRESFYVVADRDLQVRSFMKTDVLKNMQRLFRDAVASFAISVETPWLPQIEGLVREIGSWGGFTIQTKTDARDGLPKLMEINPRLGTRLWYRTQAGVNEPLMLLKCARGEPIETVAHFPQGAVVFEPIEDLLELPCELLDLCLYHFRTHALRMKPTDADNPPYTLAELATSFSTNYRPGRRKVIGIHTRHLLDDPAACLLWYYAYVGFLLRTIKKRGR